MTPVELLDKTSEVLHQRGWTKFILVNENGAMCLLGALRTAAGVGLRLEYDFIGHSIGHRAAYDAVAAQLRQCVREMTDKAGIALTEYNDEVATIIEDIDKVIQCAKEAFGTQ